MATTQQCGCVHNCYSCWGPLRDSRGSRYSPVHLAAARQPKVLVGGVVEDDGGVSECDGGRVRGQVVAVEVARRGLGAAAFVGAPSKMPPATRRQTRSQTAAPAPAPAPASAPKKKKAPKSKMVCSGKGRKGHKGDGQGRPGVTYAGAGCKK